MENTTTIPSAISILSTMLGVNLDDLNTESVVLNTPNTDKTFQIELEEFSTEHPHIKVLDPILGNIFELCGHFPGTWTYSVDGVPKMMEVVLDQVPVYGLFMPFNMPYIVQRLPRSY